MNFNTLLQSVQTGFRVSLGATTSLIETLQDPQKREENLSQLNSQFSQKVIEWAEKGQITEQEARRFIDEILRRQSNPEHPPTTATPSDRVTTPSTSTASAPPNVQLEIEELTVQIAAIRTELEKLRNSGSNN
jgi:polyhydroxyalkanoate synthesis regulator phasin